MRPMQIAVLVAVGLLSTSFTAMANSGVIRRATNVYEHERFTGAPINRVEAGQTVEVVSCARIGCRIKIPGPDGWVQRQSISALVYGADTCKNGYVWRDAIPGDHVCVTGDSRATAARENAIAGSRVDPAGAYGPNTCINGFGYVWREAYRGDVVCVSGARRTAVRQENLDGPSHRIRQ